MTTHLSAASGSIPLWLLILLTVAWILPGLIGHDPWKPDEAYSFGIVYHILQTGNWIVPTLAGEPFMEKPPLFYITAALFAAAVLDTMPKWTLAMDTLYGLGAVATVLVGILVWSAWPALEFGTPAVLVTHLGGAYAGAATGAGPVAMTMAVLCSVGALAACTYCDVSANGPWRPGRWSPRLPWG